MALLGVTSTKSVTVEDSEDTIETYIGRYIEDDELRSTLLHSNFLLVPQQGLLDDPNIAVFPSGTDEFYQFLQTHQRDGVVPEICIEEKDYKEFTRNADLVFLTATIISMAFVNIASDLVVEYLLHRLGSRRHDAVVQWEVTLYDKQSKSSKKIKYHGPVIELKETIIPILNELKALSTSENSQLNNSGGPSRRRKERNTKRKRK